MKRINSGARVLISGPLMLLFLSVMIFSGARGVSAQNNPAQAAAERRAGKLIGILARYDAAAWNKFVAENFTKTSLERVPPAARFNTLARIYDRTRGLTVKEIRPTKPAEVTAVVRDNVLGENFELLVLVEETAPHQMTAMGFRQQPPPPAGSGSGGGGATAQKLTDKQIADELDRFLKKLSAADVFSGVVLVGKGEQILFEKACGEANKDFKVPVNLDTKFNLGSMNKMFTAVAIAQLVESGKISFDDPLGKFLPDFPSREAAEKIKIKHLLTHTSGLGSYFNERFMNASRANYRTIDDYLELVGGEKPAFEPGSRWQYSNTGMLVLGKIVEKASGQSYFDYVRENIYRRAGMIGSDSYELDRVNSNLAVGYTKEFGDEGVMFRNNLFLHVISGGPAGGGYSTARDLLKFAAALQNGKLVKSETLREMRQPKPEINSPNYGYGLMLNPQAGAFGHGGDFAGVSTNLDMFSDSGYTAVVLSNYDGTRQIVAPKIYELIGNKQ